MMFFPWVELYRQGPSHGGLSIVVRFYTKASGMGVETFSLFTSPAFVELKDGTGDMAVTDASARMPWKGAAHVSQPLNHAEVLWHLPTMMSVGAFLEAAPRAASGSAAAGS
jgi:hypothetical protein